MSILRFTTCFALVAIPLAIAPLGCKSNSITSTTDGTLIGPSGGTVHGPDSTEVRIPAGALLKDTSISIVPVDSGDYPPLPGQYSDLGKVYAFLPHGLQFQTSVVVDVAFSGGTNLAVLSAEENGSWAEVTGAKFPTTTIAEVSTTSFSFYTVASTTQSDAGPATCSGRGPNNSLPDGHFMNGMGTVQGYSGGGADFDYPDVDLSTLVDGYAVQGSSAQSFCGSNMLYALAITLTPYTHACGYYANGVSKIGAGTVTILINSPMPFTTQDYTTAEVHAPTTLRAKPTTPVGACTQSGNSSAGGGGTCTGATAATITAIDATHVAGSFSFSQGDSGVLSGTFDVPFCTAQQGITSACCIQ